MIYTTEEQPAVFALLVVVLILIAMCGYLYYKLTRLESKISVLGSVVFGELSVLTEFNKMMRNLNKVVKDLVELSGADEVDVDTTLLDDAIHKLDAMGFEDRTE